MSSFTLMYCCVSSWIVFFSSIMRSCVNFRRMDSPGVSTAATPSRSEAVRFLRFGVSTFSSSLPYWAAQDFCANQSFGRFAPHSIFSDRLTDIQFWSPLHATDEARQSFSLVDHLSSGTRFICSRSCIELMAAKKSDCCKLCGYLRPSALLHSTHFRPLFRSGTGNFAFVCELSPFTADAFSSKLPPLPPSDPGV
uniref:Secreted protein n=1 Tax=Anopheles coluzzii TaxID=1518534 RepID=A0A8W7PN60_ANOCL